MSILTTPSKENLYNGLKRGPTTPLTPVLKDSISKSKRKVQPVNQKSPVLDASDKMTTMQLRLIELEKQNWMKGQELSRLQGLVEIKIKG
ncbi:hypothetical protein LJB42_002043 [Komagataella kurtzmanii]|nr:hypothetical protein LJB42_002043 [Komagataella kurtzmanii]